MKKHPSLLGLLIVLGLLTWIDHVAANSTCPNLNGIYVFRDWVADTKGLPVMSSEVRGIAYRQLGCASIKLEVGQISYGRFNPEHWTDDWKTREPLKLDGTPFCYPRDPRFCVSAVADDQGIQFSFNTGRATGSFFFYSKKHKGVCSAMAYRDFPTRNGSLMRIYDNVWCTGRVKNYGGPLKQLLPSLRQCLQDSWCEQTEQ